MTAHCVFCPALRSQLASLREALAEAVGYELTGNVDEDDAQLVDRLDARLAAAYADGYSAGAAATRLRVGET